ncbi:ATP-binding cassette domain-containing protein [Actinoplanes sp. NPDC051411]|uniref:ATP-binding cassette domain-containing protein n=1 Tax=Actinoplanes sp. NPDC051411 TaxID=3155522 RepID=UPI003420B82C
MTSLELHDVSARYGAVTAVQPLTLTLEAGARHAIIGPNGAGKSTLLHVIAGSRPAAGGRILLGARDITRHAPDRRARHGIARTFQHPGTIAGLTVADNMHLALPAMRRAARAAAVAEALAMVGLTTDSRLLAGQLPYGRRRLLELGMALASRPRLLLLDEPSAGLDPAGIEQLTTLLTALPVETTVVLVDHHLPLVWTVADTVTVLHHGAHLATGARAAIQADPQVQAAYLNAPTTASDGPLTVKRKRQPVMVQVRGLRTGYHGADVLHGVNLDLRRGVVHAVLGRNGSGKTTLLNTLAGLHPARGGRIRIEGTDLRQGRRPAGRPAVAIVPQGRRLFAQLSTAEHLRLAARRRSPAGVPWDIDAVLELMPALRETMNRPPTQLSGGQQQFLALARALLAGPQLLLLDEPTEGLAPALITHLQDVIARLAARGQTVLLAEQNLGFALAVAHRVSVLADGRITDTHAAANLDDPAQLRRLHRHLGVTDAESPHHDTAQGEPFRTGEGSPTPR